MARDMYTAMAAAQEHSLERARIERYGHHLQSSRVNHPNAIAPVTWFGGIKATARFLSDSLREVFAEARIATARN